MLDMESNSSYFPQQESVGNPFEQSMNFTGSTRFQFESQTERVEAPNFSKNINTKFY